MKNSLNKTFLWGSTFALLIGDNGWAQPIQLVPTKKGSVETFASLPPQSVSGFWEGTPPSVMETYFPKLPLHLNSRTLRQARDKVLNEKYTPLLQNPAYEKTLLSLFMETGQLDPAKELLAGSQLLEKDALLLNIQWLEGAHKKACEKISNLIRQSPNAEWKTQNIYCLYFNGETERGKIAVELLSESNPDIFPLMNTLFDPAFPPTFEPSIGKSPFLLTVWCASGQEIPDTVLKSMSPASLALIAKSEKAHFKTRLLAAEYALKEGALKGDVLVQLFKDSPKTDVLEFFNDALQNPKTEPLLLLFKKAQHEQKLGLVGEIFSPLLSKINPSPETLELAPYMIRAFLEGGEKDFAQKWGTFFMREVPDEAVSILPLLHLAFPQTKCGEPHLQAWQAYQSRNHPDRAAENSSMLRHVFEALGETPVPPLKGEAEAPSWRQEKTLFDEKALALLESAATSNRKGEVLLLVLTMIGDTPLKDLSSVKLARLLTVLKKAGFEQEARSLALEFLLAKGI
jgi:hypothetical protein